MRLKLIPAYGRKYETAEAAATDFRNGKDFLELKTGLYCNLEDCERSKIDYVETLYFTGNRMQNTFVFIEEVQHAVS